MYKRGAFDNKGVGFIHITFSFIVFIYVVIVLNGYHVSSYQVLHLGSRFLQLEALEAFMGSL